MSPKTLASATIAAVTLVAAAPAQAQIWPFGRDRDAAAGAARTGAAIMADTMARRESDPLMWHFL